MTGEARNQFLAKIESLDIEIGDALAADDLAELVALAGRASLVAASAMLYQEPAPPPTTCVCCERPAAIQAGDWDLCEGCYNAVSTPWPGIDECWGELEEINEPVY